MNQSQKKKLRAETEWQSSQGTRKGLPAPDKNNFEGDSSLIASDQSNQQNHHKEFGAIKKLAGIFEMILCVGRAVLSLAPCIRWCIYRLCFRMKHSILVIIRPSRRPPFPSISSKGSVAAVSSLTSDCIDISLSSSEDPPPPLAEILFARRPYLSDVLVEHGKCAGLGPSSVTEILEPIAEGPIPSHDRLALERLAFVAYGLMYELRKPKGLSPSRRRELQGQRVTDSIASRMEEDFARGLGIATPIEPFTKEELFQYLIESLWIWVQDDRCKIELL
ncbi:uncharacterized protein MELLADRAFT_112488 [Melampsora larici-populina 98AG31]|uniref:Uncharacterized protein n=1 Tax=Melampsora larici-populina (strain 98AG31 / pathotype 3-4-7) TaxID=747676 RepID=F4S6M5_MELLP|nr:uncharacterized protein MELLADRAFT_112488 [Melampsora larici-populina 98AG31]EGF99717.1 hypothetical protein MELLADRAFT_112488 [Melampsora larici-populina 98AG31]